MIAKSYVISLIRGERIGKKDGWDRVGEYAV